MHLAPLRQQSARSDQPEVAAQLKSGHAALGNLRTRAESSCGSVRSGSVQFGAESSGRSGHERSGNFAESDRSS